MLILNKTIYLFFEKIYSNSTFHTPAASSLEPFLKFSIFRLGDNLNTAVSVAKQCGMIQPDDKVIQVKRATHKVNLTGSRLGTEGGVSFQLMQSQEKVNQETSKDYGSMSNQIVRLRFFVHFATFP